MFFPLMLSQYYGLNATQRSYMFIPSIITGFLGTLVGGALIDYFSRRKPSQVLVIVGVFGLIATLPLGVLAFGPPVWLVIVVYSSCASFAWPRRPVAAARSTPRSRRRNVRSLGVRARGPLLELPHLILWTPMAFVDLRRVRLQDRARVRRSRSASSAALHRPVGRAAVRRRPAQRVHRGHGVGRDPSVPRAADDAKLLVCRDVCVEYSGVQVLFNVDFDVREGEIIALLGTNGAGKSTLLRAICGISEASDGAIVFDGRDITHSPPNEIAGAQRHLHARWPRRVPGPHRARQPAAGELAHRRPARKCATASPRCSRSSRCCSERADVNASTMSGGEQQMLSLALAFLARPSCS